MRERFVARLRKREIENSVRIISNENAIVFHEKHNRLDARALFRRQEIRRAAIPILIEVQQFISDRRPDFACFGIDRDCANHGFFWRRLYISDRDGSPLSRPLLGPEFSRGQSNFIRGITETVLLADRGIRQIAEYEIDLALSIAIDAPGTEQSLAFWRRSGPFAEGARQAATRIKNDHQAIGTQ